MRGLANILVQNMDIAQIRNRDRTIVLVGFSFDPLPGIIADLRLIEISLRLLLKQILKQGFRLHLSNPVRNPAAPA